MFRNIRMKLITLLAGKMAVCINCNINGKGIKKGWSAFSMGTNEKTIITS